MPSLAPSAVVIGAGRVGNAISRFYQPTAPMIHRNQQVPRDLGEVRVMIWALIEGEGV
jgi:hypothetical protein